MVRNVSSIQGKQYVLDAHLSCVTCIDEVNKFLAHLVFSAFKILSSFFFMPTRKRSLRDAKLISSSIVPFIRAHAHTFFNPQTDRWDMFVIKFFSLSSNASTNTGQEIAFQRWTPI